MPSAKLTDEIFYLILDGGDGSAFLKLFASKEALALYIDFQEKLALFPDLSEGGSSIDQTDIDSALTVSDVNIEFNHESK